MGQEQMGTISGTIYDLYTEDSQEYKEGRMPRIGQTVEFEDGRKFIFGGATIAIGANRLVRPKEPEDVLTVGDTKAGATEIKVVQSSAYTRNIYAEGKLFLAESGALPIRGSTIVDGDGNIILTLWEPLSADVADGTTVTIQTHLMYLVDSSGGGSVPIACTLQELFDNGTRKYTWFQYQGPGACRTNATVPGVALQGSAGGGTTTKAGGSVKITVGVLKGTRINEIAPVNFTLPDII